MITAWYGSFLGLLWFALTLAVIFGRWKFGISLGDGEQKELNRRIRAHANFVETVPLALILLWFFETYIRSATFCHMFGLALVVGRLVHAVGMLYPKRTTNILRQTGMALTMAVISSVALWLFVVLSKKNFLTFF